MSAEERAAIMIEKGRNTSISAIARLLGRSASTITRELARNRAESPRGYDATGAALAYRARRARCRRQPKLAVGNALYWQVHHDLVYRRWSPQQIAARLREMHTDSPDQRVSHETIYAAIYTHPRGGLKQAMIEALRQEKPVRGNMRKTLARKSFVPEELRIIHRPEQIETRQWRGSLGRRFDQRRIQSLLRRHAGRAQDAVRGAVPHGWLYGPRCAGRLHAPDEEAPGLSP
ncbi:IS30 family transposase [Burkholderia anthina]|uniref:IS30 family transposase n=1 Tax=Burkholderia anthina TaxID=179879 RepID=UPI0022AA0E5F|nr:IS30 family transposase [Burkholderia anthina]